VSMEFPSPAHAVDSDRIESCPLCGSQRLHFNFGHQGYRVESCIDCGFQLLNPQPSDEALATIYSPTYFLGGGSADSSDKIAAMKQATARAYLSDIIRYRGSLGGRLLEIGCGLGDFLIEADREGFQVTGVELSPSAAATARRRVPLATIHYGFLENVPLPPNSFDVCVLCDVIEHVRQPLEFMRTLHRLLKPDGVVFLATPSLDSWSAKSHGRRRTEYKPERLSYFNTQTIQNLLYRAGYQQVIVRPGWIVSTLSYVASQFDRFPIPGLTSLVKGLRCLTPRWLREPQVRMVASGMAVYACPSEVKKETRLSVIVPVYNEAATFDTLMKALLQKKVAGMEIEIVIVESASNDGSRELAERYRHHPRVKLVLEDRPRGKGHAVRTGFQHVAGEFILIQDADLEYDLDDYDALLEPLRQGRASFVLGARHGGNAFKMRQFEKQPLLAAMLNAGHYFFRMLVNLLFRLNLNDPFTMYKVFRRDCLEGLTFHCNRFDFDFELLLKLVRKGYRPLEIPVNYRSRSFKQGKKVSVLRDPVTWLWALLRLRMARIDPIGEIATQRSQAEVQTPTNRAG